MQKVSYRWHAQNQSGFRQVQTDSQTSFNMFFLCRVVCDESSQREGDPRGGGGGVKVSHFFILQYTNESIRLMCLASFIVDKVQTSLNMFMREVGYLIIVLNSVE